MCIVRERGELESDLARAWWNLKPQTLLTLEDGRPCVLIYSGQPGGPAGPDVRDAVLRLLPAGEQTEAAPDLTGDVEFHLRASDWFAHGHQHDRRYNQVILHVVYYLDHKMPIRRQDGALVPTCSLLDYAQPPETSAPWPCQQHPLAAQALTATLLYAGLLRFTEKSAAFEHALQETPPALDSAFDRYDTCLLPALAEGLAYGRDRAFFRAAGLRLVGLPVQVPEPLGRAPEPAPLDRRRLHALSTLCERWRASGGWQTLSPILRSEQSVKTAAPALRAALHPLNRARADILIVNCVLPFACAVAALEGDVRLASRARQLYLAYPGLASNRITRMMSTQLQLPAEPDQTCLQQGLHYVYRHTCQAKRCQDCLCGGRRL
jgi:hypothetical protein